MTVKGSVRTMVLPLNPHRKQERKLNLILSACRHVHNELTGRCRGILKANREIRAGFLEDGPSWEDDGLSVGPAYLPLPSGFDLVKEAGRIRNATPWMKGAYAACVRSTGRDVGRNASRYLSDVMNGVRRGLPRFKSEDRFDTFTYADSRAYRLSDDWLKGGCGPRIHLGGVGDVRFSNERNARRLPHLGVLKQAVVKRTRSGNRDRWSLIVYYDTVEPRLFGETDLERPGNEPVGIDVGARKTAVLSDGTVVENPRLNERTMRRRAKLQRRISESPKGSPERRRYLGYLNHMNKHIRDLRSDLFHKATREIALRHDLIVVEDLKVTDINNLSNNRKTHRRFSDACPGEFLRMLGYKAEEAGARVIRVDPAYTSRTCSGCGARTDPGASETFTCSSCGLTLDRDLNASRNILRRGMGYDIRGTSYMPESQRGTPPMHVNTHPSGSRTHSNV